MTVTLREGAPEPLGLTLDESGANIAVAAARARSVTLSLFDAEGAREVEQIVLQARTGDVFHGHVAGLRAGVRYGLRATGSFDPTSGDRYDPAKLLLDPYAMALDRSFRLDAAMMTFGAETAPCMPKGIVTAATTTPAPRGPRTAWAESVIYELHVRGFTRLHPAVPEAIRGTFAALSHPAVIAHLTGLGITAIEVMPAAAWIDERHLGPLGLSDYWGYNPVALMAPDPRLAPGGFAEIRETVATLHAAGIEMILDVVLNHTGEGDEAGPTVSLRGLDNRGYYRVQAEDPARYVNDTGCGNTLALDRPGVLRLAMDTLRCWARETGLDGFRFDLATTLGRRDEGFDERAPLLSAIAQDPMLRELKLIAEPWDVGPGGHQLGRFPPLWAEWNDRYRDAVRGFWRGESGQAGELATRVAGSADLFKAHGRPSRSINAITTHDGFTLADLVSYAEKHNLANGEENRDGRVEADSWNHGIEGETGDPAICTARRQDQRSLILTLFASRGTPMLEMGSELGHSQAGNNNAYAQDNRLTWLDWQDADASLTDFTRLAIAARRRHPALHEDRFLDGVICPGSELPDVVWRTPSGAEMRAEDWQAAENRTLIAVLGAVGASGFDRVVVVLNAGEDETRVTLPDARDGFGWRLELASAPAERVAADLEEVVLAPRSAALVAEVATAREGGRRAVPAAMLERLVSAAGIAASWWDLQGKRHNVGIATKRALLAAMGLPATSRSEAEESLAKLAVRARRALPEAKVVRLSAPIWLPLGRPGERGRGVVRVTVQREDGGVEQYDAEGDEALLGALPIGQHRVVRDDQPDSPCSLTVAPARCFMPEALAAGAKRFGVAAHLYTLRREGDQGIGDFTTLGAFAERAGAAGAATLGINPLHLLFPEKRERASPYHPSDRRFLDPIYLDVTDLAPCDETAAVRALLAAHADEIARLSATSLVLYERVWELKRKVLEAAFVAFEELSPDTAPMRDFERFVAAGGESLYRLACFEAIAESEGKAWQRWPDALSSPRAPGVARFAEKEVRRLRFQLFLQFLCDAQLARAAERARGGLALGFYRDLAVGAAADGAEAWASEGILVHGVAIGAPPDRFAPEGQNWNLAPPDPLHPKAQSAFAEMLAANMRHAGALRIDHVMGLTRLFWIPAGAEARDGSYVSYPLEDLLGQLALQSTRARTLVVGEDLGTVPDGLRARLRESAVLGCSVLWFERDGALFRAPGDYPRDAVASVSTHDLPTLAGWWLGLDLQERTALGMASEDDGAGRAAEKRYLVEALVREGLLDGEIDFDAEPTPALVGAIHAYLARTPAVLALIQADDLAGAKTAVNLPGTDRERPNWRRKLEPTIDRLFRTETARAILTALFTERAAPEVPGMASGA